MPNILSLLWFCQYAPDSSAYAPLYVAATELPVAFTRGTMHAYTTESAWYVSQAHLDLSMLSHCFYALMLCVTGGMRACWATTPLVSTNSL